MSSYVFKKPARPVDRVFVHCSASDNPDHDSAAVINDWHKQKGWAGIGYHFFIRKNGVLEQGRSIEKTPAAQEGNNTGTIAICLHGLAGDKFTEAQFDTLRNLCDQINQAYGGAITFHGHCEVSKKTCPVFDYRAFLDLDPQGKMALKRAAIVPLELAGSDFGDLEALKGSVIVLKRGFKGELVKDLQKALTELGYFSGAIDGDFGGRTEAAVLAFQADNHLETDGKVGSLTREALAEAAPRAVAPARAFAGFGDLVASGSRIAKASRNNAVIGAVLGAGGLATIIEDVTGQADVIGKLFDQHGLAAGIAILAAGAFVAWQSWRAGQARVQDHRTGKTA